MGLDLYDCDAIDLMCAAVADNSTANHALKTKIYYLFSSVIFSTEHCLQHPGILLVSL